MKQLINVLYQHIKKQVVLQRSNIVRIEGFDNPLIYQGVCKKIDALSMIDEFIPKLTREKYFEFYKAGKAEWSQALGYLHQGRNSMFSATVTNEYAEKSFVDFNNAITKWRNESANHVSNKTSLILLMGTEAAQDTGGLADTSFVISPKEIISGLSKDYSVWFKNVIETNDIHEEYHLAIHTLYRALFTQISTDIFKLSDFIDSLDELEFSSVQDLVRHICETLNVIWNIPSIVDKKAVPDVSRLSKGTLNSAKILIRAEKFIDRSDDIPTASAMVKLHKKFAKYIEESQKSDETAINPEEPFPKENPLFTNYEGFEKTVTDFMQGINIDANREKLLQVDFGIVDAIINTKIDKPIKEKKAAFSGAPVEAYSRMFLDTVKNFYDIFSVYPTKINLRVTGISLSDCTDDQKAESYLNVCNFVGGILNFFNDLTIDIDGQILEFNYDAYDPFDFINYDLVKPIIKCSGKWGDPFKIQFVITALNDNKKHDYDCKWSFSPYAPWLNAFSYLTYVFYSKGPVYVLPTMVYCSNIQDYLDCESEDEFYAHLQQFRGNVLYDAHKAVIRQYFASLITGLFDLVCNNFKEFAEKLTQRGFFNAGNELRAVVDSYTVLLKTIQDNFDSFTDAQKEKLDLLVNMFTISSNSEILDNGDMGDVIVPAFNPIMLEKIDAQQLFLRRGFKEIFENLMSGKYTNAVLKTKFEELIQLSTITQASDIIRKVSDNYLMCKNIWEYFGVYFGDNNVNDLLTSSAVGPSIVTDDEDIAMLQKTPMSSIIVRNVIDYVSTFPARVDGLNVAFVAPSDMQHIVAAIHTIAKRLDNEECPATINIKIICVNSKKNSASYLRRWLDSYFSDEKNVKVNTYLHNSTINSKIDVDEIFELLKNYDLCFTYNILQSNRVRFGLSSEQPTDMDYEKFPMTFTPDTIPASHGKIRKVNLSQFQFLAAKQHTQTSFRMGNPLGKKGVVRAYKQLTFPDIQRAIIDVAHATCKWVVCVDQAIDRHVLDDTEGKIIGFTTGEGSYGELNVTVSARKDILADIKQMLRRRITDKFSNWDVDRLQKAADYCVDELSKYMDGSRILKALNPYDYEIHNFLAYTLTLQMLGLTKQNNDYIARSLISLDSYKHWFSEDDEFSDNNIRPDFMLIEIPYIQENRVEGTKLVINAKIVECKMGYQNDNQIEKAKVQVEKGLRTMAMNWQPDAGGVMHRYWLNQLYRAIIFAPLYVDDSSPEYPIIRDKLYGILNGNYEINWTGDIFAFWLDVNDDIHDYYEIYSPVQSELSGKGILIDKITCHNCGQMFIQKMLLPEKERTGSFSYNLIISPEDSGYEETTGDDEMQDGVDSVDEIDITPEIQTEDDSEKPDAKVEKDKDKLSNTSTIPRTKEIYIPFIAFLSDGLEHTRKESLNWYKNYFSISESDQKEVFESNGHAKYETMFDFAITDFRKSQLLENSKVGSFHITDLGKQVAALINIGEDTTNFFDTIDKAKALLEKQDVSDDNDEKPKKEVINQEENDNHHGDTIQQGGKQKLEDIRVLIGKDKKNLPIYWEFGHKQLANRHILITGTSGQGKTYAIQTMILELARQGISSVVFDYTDGFLPGKLEPEFEKELEGKITQKVALINKIPVNPFRLQMIEIPPFGSVPEQSTSVAGRISDILRHVYSFGDQQAASIYAACKQGVDQYGMEMDFAKLRQLLEDMGTSQSKSVLAKMAQFFDMNLFDSTQEFDWQDITRGGGKVTVIQLTGLDRELQTVVTEIMMWDAWYSLTKIGNKNTPFVVVLDEAQNLSFKEKSPAEKILREGRKYGWSAWFATQFLKGALDSGEISNLQQAAERLYFKPTGEEMSYISEQIAGSKSETAEWFNIIKGIQKGQCVVQGDRIRLNGQFGAAKPSLVSVSSFAERSN